MSFCPSVLRERVYDKSFAKPSGEGWKYERRAAHFQMVNDDRDFSLSQECVNLALPKLGCCCEPLSKSSWLRHFSFWLVERRISDEGVRVFWHHFLAAFSTKQNAQKDFTLFENQWQSRIQHCERSELRLHFERTKVYEKCQKMSILANF